MIQGTLGIPGHLDRYQPAPSRGAGPICLRDSFSLGKKDAAKVGLRIPNWANESGEPHAWVDVRLPFVHLFQLLEHVRHTWHCDSLPCSMISMSLMWLVKGALFGDLIFFTIILTSMVFHCGGGKVVVTRPTLPYHRQLIDVKPGVATPWLAATPSSYRQKLGAIFLGMPSPVM